MQRVCGHGIVEKPSQCDRGIEDKALQLRPSWIRFFTLKPFGRLTCFRISSISLKMSSRLADGRAGPSTAASFAATRDSDPLALGSALNYLGQFLFSFEQSYSAHGAPLL
jgi:hypothetical protein